jgi:hypothetical protein
MKDALIQLDKNIAFVESCIETSDDEDAKTILEEILSSYMALKKKIEEISESTK